MYRRCELRWWANGAVRHRVPRAYSGDGGAETSLHVNAESLQRRNVKHPHARLRVDRLFAEGDPTNGHQKSRERLARTCRSQKERVSALIDLLPGSLLSIRESGKTLLKPFADERWQAVGESLRDAS